MSSDFPRFPYVRPYGKFFDDAATPLRKSLIKKGAGIDRSRRTLISSFKSESIGESRRIRSVEAFFFLGFSRENNTTGMRGTRAIR